MSSNLSYIYFLYVWQYITLSLFWPNIRLNNAHTLFVHISVTWNASLTNQANSIFYRHLTVLVYLIKNILIAVLYKIRVIHIRPYSDSKDLILKGASPPWNNKTKINLSFTRAYSVGDSSSYLYAVGMKLQSIFSKIILACSYESWTINHPTFLQTPHLNDSTLNDTLLRFRHYHIHFYIVEVKGERHG